MSIQKKKWRKWRLAVGIIFFITQFSTAFPEAQSQLVLNPSLNPALAWTEFQALINTPKELAGFLKKNFRFVEDDRLFGLADYWQNPEEFLRRKAGDCEDYALFAQYVLEKLGFDSFVVSFYAPDGFAHTVTVYQDGEKFNVINEDRLYKYRSKTIEEALSRIHPTWTWGAIAQEKEKRGWKLQTLRNPAFKKS